MRVIKIKGSKLDRTATIKITRAEWLRELFYLGRFVDSDRFNMRSLGRKGDHVVKY